MDEASKQKTEAEQLQEFLNKEQKSISKRKEDIEVELSEVAPLVEQAKKAVGSIKKDNLTEIRSLKTPPDPIRDVLEGVLKLVRLSLSAYS